MQTDLALFLIVAIVVTQGCVACLLAFCKRVMEKQQQDAAQESHIAGPHIHGR